jgi:hypothetical protein
MNLGHGRAGHLPDYSFIRYRYLPAWGDYDEIFKDNPSDYMKAFTQMVYALRYLRGDIDSFETDTYDTETVEPYREEIDAIIRKRQLNACDDWKALGESMSGCEIDILDINRYQGEYIDAVDKENTFLGKFFKAAIAHKSMVTNRIYSTGNKLAGISVTQKKGVR